MLSTLKYAAVLLRVGRGRNGRNSGARVDLPGFEPEVSSVRFVVAVVLAAGFLAIGSSKAIALAAGPAAPIEKAFRS